MKKLEKEQYEKRFKFFETRFKSIYPKNTDEYLHEANTLFNVWLAKSGIAPVNWWLDNE